MNYLLSGGYCPKKLDILLEDVGLRSEDIIAAISDYLIRGASIEVAASLNLVDPANLNRAIKKLNTAAERFERWNQLCTKSDGSKNVTKVTEKKPRVKKPESWKMFFGSYPANKKGGTDSTAWKLAKSEKLTEDDFRLMLDDVLKRSQLMPSWGSTYAQGISKYIREKIWLTPITPEGVDSGQKRLGGFNQQRESAAQRSERQTGRILARPASAANRPAFLPCDAPNVPQPMGISGGPTYSEEPGNGSGDIHGEFFAVDEEVERDEAGGHKAWP